MAAKYLFTASELGVFAAIPDEGCTLAELSRAVAVMPRTLRMVTDALVGLGLLVGEGVGDARRYRHTPSTRHFLSRRTPVDLTPFLRFWDRLSYRGWVEFSRAVRTGNVGIGGVAPTPEEMEILLEGMETVTAASARSLADSYDFSRHSRLLDLGGGAGAFPLQGAPRYPGLTGTLFDLAIDSARERLASAGLSGRFAVVEGDFFVDPIPDGHDVVLLASILHYFGPEQDRALLRRVRAVSAPGTRLLLLDFWLDATRTAPLFNALMAGEFLVVDGGDAYSVDQVREWLAETGWRFDEHRVIGGAQSLILATAEGAGT
jgi:hypothetical protein